MVCSGAKQNDFLRIGIEVEEGMSKRKKMVRFVIEDGCGNYIVLAQFGKFRYIVAETRGRSKAQLDRLNSLVHQANANFNDETTRANLEKDWEATR